MAEADQDDKTEEPTGRRLQKAREDGQVPRSKELNTAAVLILGAVGLLVFGPMLALSIKQIMIACFTMSRDDAVDVQQIGVFLVYAVSEIGLALAPLLGILLLAALFGPLALGGWLLSAKALQPKFSKLNPIEGIKKLFKLNALVELIKAIFKVVFVMAVAVVLLHNLRFELLGLGNEPILPAMEHASTILGWVFLALCLPTIVIAAIDIPFQIFEHNKKLRMTKQEVKDEFKDTEGKPEVKQKIRQLQMERAFRRMMQNVPEADVVITNPTHYAVALKYDGKSMAAPRMVAKGADQVAAKIREIAASHKIEIVSAPILARAVYYNTEIDDEIPAGLYMAVAQVLAYIYQLRQFRRGQAQRPPKPDFPVPEDLRHD
ncbi:flagellar biosynthesis protein FlhB [Oleiphilus messinensis]|uniref:Flagellar biosynthetic protein FlhB n=1 Tax=Oleiphilus messinensis TaxID=141451 RepID=A0A1Y0IAL9_9GAMM|nr:flagellar biosynthesis protein FlhB [Oleiphilus messinensis]ARU57567.1 flagellar biosynthesis protein FlhB [Oleiphilus messinensis]